MVVYGGYFENGIVSDEMLCLNIEFEEWTKIQVTNPLEGIAQAACAQVYCEPY